WARAQAVSSSTPRKAGSMVPVMTTTPAWPTARAAMVHDTSWPTTVHGPGPLAPPMLTGAGTTSVTLIPVADDGPVLVTVMVEVMGRPAVAGSGESVLLTASAAWRTTSVCSVSHTSTDSGDDAQAWLVKPDGAPGETMPWIVTVTDDPGLIVPAMQVTFWPEVVHGPCVDDADVADTSAGRLSVIITLVAVDGPCGFVTTMV